jgi:hypothetical protein
MEKNKKAVLADHRRKGKRFIPPFVTELGSLEEVGWLDYSLPELVWLAVLNERCGLERGADLAVSLAKEAEKVCAGEIKKWFAPLSIYDRQLGTGQKNDVLKALRRLRKLGPLKGALCSFISLYPACPLNFLFENTLPSIDTSNEEFKKFKNLLSKLYDKRTIEATFMQADAIYIAFVTDKLRASKGTSLANFPGIEKYPRTEESQRIAGACRATINGFIGSDRDMTSEWPRYFWNRGLELEPCDLNRLIEEYE